MEESPSEMSCDDIVQQLAERNESLKWSNAALAVILQQAGGAIEISREDLDSIDFGLLTITLTHKPETDSYLLEGVFE